MDGAGRRCAVIAAVITYRFVATKASAAQMRIVVLPFQNLTGDPNRNFSLMA